MGNKNNKVAPLSLTLVVQRLNDCLIPDDREKILDFLELIDIGLTVKDEKAASKAAKQLKDADGVLLIIKLMKRLIDGKVSHQIVAIPSN